jgi:hypothetical protein
MKPINSAGKGKPQDHFTVAWGVEKDLHRKFNSRLMSFRVTWLV